MAKRKKSKKNDEQATVEQNLLDRELRLAIDAQLPVDARKSSTPDIEVEVTGGYVLLRGIVRTYREKERLHRFVMGLRGVRALKDDLRIRPLETINDRQVALHVRQAMDAHSELPPGTATVHVRDGVCTLKGHVCNAEERHIAEEVTSHCRGVKKVVNQLNVDQLDEFSDAATTRAVKCALAYCKDFDIHGITVSCADGIVVLRGMVPTMMDKMLAEEMTRIQSGVCMVENHIQVAGEKLSGDTAVLERPADTSAPGKKSVRRKSVRAKASARSRKTKS